MYFELENMQNYQFGRMPSMTYNNPEKEFYMTPDRKNSGVKLGQHRISSKDYQNYIKDEQLKESLKKVAKEWFGDKIKKINKFEECYYTVTKTYEFIVDWMDPG